MTQRTHEEWQTIMNAHVKSALSTGYFCCEHNIPIQTFYSRQHSMGLAILINKKQHLTFVVPYACRFQEIV